MISLKCCDEILIPCALTMLFCAVSQLKASTKVFMTRWSSEMLSKGCCIVEVFPVYFI